MIHDPQGGFSGSVLVPLDLYVKVLRHFDGSRTLDEIEAQFARENGQSLPADALHVLVRELDGAMILDGPTFASFERGFRESDCRPAALAGRSYAAAIGALCSELEGYFAAPGGAGTSKSVDPGGARSLRAVISPHIDYQRGGPTYTWAYRELGQASDAAVFVILGVAHQYTRRRFVLTRKDFETPLGVARTDRAYVDRITEAAGRELFDDELVHRTEHSIEFQVVFLQHVLGKDRPFSIVPILVGSFHDLVAGGREPIDEPTIARFVQALRDAEAASGQRVAYIGGIDLCHVGPEFGDTGPVSADLLSVVRGFDAEMLGHAASVDPAGWFRTAARISNRYRICGLAATYTMLHAIGPASGRLLRHDLAIDPRRTCCVSFASMVFHAEDGPEPAPGKAPNHGTR